MLTLLSTNALKAVSTRSDKETNLILARTTSALHEFHAADTEIPLASFANFVTFCSSSPPSTHCSC